MMENKLNNRSFAGLFIIVIIFLSLFVINQWLIGQMDDIQKEMVEEKGNPSSAPSFVGENSPRHGTPQIDPANDPLAPVILKAEAPPMKQQIESVNEEVNTKKQYEFAIQDTGLPQ